MARPGGLEPPTSGLEGRCHSRAALDALGKPARENRFDGKSLLPLLMGEADSHHDTLFWSKGKDDEWNRNLAPLLNQYYTEAYGEEFLGHPTKGLRTIPINQTVEDPKTIMPYEDVVKVVENFKVFEVAHSAWGRRHALDPAFGEDHCKHDTENCLHFDTLAKYKLQNGIGREITKEETLEIF